MKDNNNVLEWDFDIPILNNRFIMGGVALALGIPAGIVAIIVGAFYLNDIRSGATMQESDPSMLPGILFILALLFGLTALIILVVYKNRIQARFKLDSQGIHYFTREEAYKKNTALNTLLFFLSITKNRPGAASAAVGAQITQNESIRWKNIKKIKTYDSSKAILVKGGFGSKIMLYCHEDNYEKIKEFLKGRISG